MMSATSDQDHDAAPAAGAASAAATAAGTAEDVPGGGSSDAGGAAGSRSSTWAFSEEAVRNRSVKAAAAVMFPRQPQADDTTGTPCEAVQGSMVDRLVGVLYGTGCGDALGSNLEFLSAEDIRRKWGYVKDLKHSTSRPLGGFTDDTEMTVALAEAVLATRPGDRLDPGVCAKAYTRHAVSPPLRGYGPSVMRVFHALDKEGADPAQTGRMVHPDGSWANGGLMRIALVGLVFPEEQLHDAVTAALLCTHVHPEAIDATFLCALLAKRLSSTTTPTRTTEAEDGDTAASAPVGDEDGGDEGDDALDLEDGHYLHDFSGDGAAALAALRADLAASERVMAPLLRELTERARDERVRRKLVRVAELHAAHASDEAAMDALVEQRDFGKHFAIRASDCLGVVTWLLLRGGAAPERTLCRAVNLGGDADTVGAIVGALLGAWHGTAWLPARWWTRLEDDASTTVRRSAFASLGAQLAQHAAARTTADATRSTDSAAAAAAAAAGGAQQA